MSREVTTLKFDSSVGDPGEPIHFDTGYEFIPTIHDRQIILDGDRFMSFNHVDILKGMRRAFSFRKVVNKDSQNIF